MNDWKPEHYRFLRQSGFRRSDFTDHPGGVTPMDVVVFVVSAVILGLIAWGVL